MRARTGGWAKTWRHFVEVDIGKEKHWLRMPSPARQAQIRAAAVARHEPPATPPGETPAPGVIAVRAALIAADLALYAGIVGLAWGSSSTSLATADPAIDQDIRGYGSAVWEELYDAEATETQIARAATLVLDRLREAVTAEEVAKAEGF